MKSALVLIVVSIATISSSMADMPLKILNCQTARDRFGGGTSIQIVDQGPYDATISGSQNGGMATFIRDIGPISVKVTHEADGTIYENSQEGVELSIFTTPIMGRLVTSASFVEGKGSIALQMTCELK